MFRLANYLQPACVFEIGTGSGLTARYLAEACPRATVFSYSDKREEAVERILSARSNITYLSGNFADKINRMLILQDIKPELIHIADTPDYAYVFDVMSQFADERTCIVIAHPYADEKKKNWWKEEILEDPLVRVTFDLYDVGLVFFDKKRAKENHIVNFL